jgi:S-adenosylmethionine:tRNA ribosyltransferase-isomerase
MNPGKAKISDYLYHLPDENIALEPLANRDASKLLVYQNQTISHHVFNELPELLPKEGMLVFNNAKVIPARMYFEKPTGGVIEIFLLSPWQESIQLVLEASRPVEWECLVGGLKKWKEGKIQWVHKDLVLSAERTGKGKESEIIKFEWNKPEINFAGILEIAGNIPLPPYINRQLSPEDKIRYQTIFASREGSVAAPTAGLHFSDNVLKNIKDRGNTSCEVTLHVSAGTFKPVKTELMNDHQMHEETIEIDKQVIYKVAQQLTEGKKIIAVGTTTLRTLETLYWLGLASKHKLQTTLSQWFPYQQENETLLDPAEALNQLIKQLEIYNLNSLEAKTSIYITPGYNFKIASELITNFHQPGSTLLLLVSAITNDSWRPIYREALLKGYRFLSYGDACYFKNLNTNSTSA